MAGKSNDQIAFGEVSDHDYLAALIAAGGLPPTVVPGFVGVEPEPGSNEPGFDTAGAPVEGKDPRRDEEADEAEAKAREELRGGEDRPESSVADRQAEEAAAAEAEDAEDSAETEDEPARDASGRFTSADEE